MVRVTRLTDLGWVTGEQSSNRTGQRFGVHATDLGVCWDSGRGEVLLAFGDSYGAGWGGNGAGPAGADWRWNLLARSTSTALDRGLAIDDMVRRHDGAAGQVLHGEPTRREHTVIPTAGIAVGERNFLHYMSVRRWGVPGGWRTNHGGIAYSDDGGTSWQRPRHSRWPNTRAGDHPFQMGAFARDPADDRWLYLLGTANGRFGSPRLARVGLADVLEPAAYRYLGEDGWQPDPLAAAPVMPGPVGELSVAYHRQLGRWVALHLDERRAAIVLRTAGALRGPWTGGEVVVSGRDYPGLYGGYLHPWALDTSAVYFLMSQWGPYNVRLLRAEVTG